MKWEKLQFLHNRKCLMYTITVVLSSNQDVYHWGQKKSPEIPESQLGDEIPLTTKSSAMTRCPGLASTIGWHSLWGSSKGLEERSSQTPEQDYWATRPGKTRSMVLGELDWTNFPHDKRMFCWRVLEWNLANATALKGGYYKPSDLLCSGEELSD